MNIKKIITITLIGGIGLLIFSGCKKTDAKNIDNNTSPNEIINDIPLPTTGENTLPTSVEDPTAIHPDDEKIVEDIINEVIETPQDSGTSQGSGE